MSVVCNNSKQGRMEVCSTPWPPEGMNGEPDQLVGMIRFGFYATLFFFSWPVFGARLSAISISLGISIQSLYFADSVKTSLIMHGAGSSSADGRWGSAVGLVLLRLRCPRDFVVCIFISATILVLALHQLNPTERKPSAASCGWVGLSWTCEGNPWRCKSLKGVVMAAAGGYHRAEQQPGPL